MTHEEIFAIIMMFHGATFVALLQELIDLIGDYRIIRQRRREAEEAAELEIFSHLQESFKRIETRLMANNLKAKTLTARIDHAEDFRDLVEVPDPKDKKPMFIISSNDVKFYADDRIYFTSTHPTQATIDEKGGRNDRV